MAQRPVAVIDDAMDASAIDFDMCENAMVLRRQGGSHGAGEMILPVLGLAPVGPRGGIAASIVL
jgi:hypothetical protein